MKTVLVVDDSKTARKVTRECLAKSGCFPTAEIIDAENGRLALDTIKSRQVDLVFTDSSMPEMDGLELVTQLKANPRWKGIPVIVVSAMDNRLKAEFLKLGVDGILFKPVFVEDLKKALERVIPPGQLW